MRMPAIVPTMRIAATASAAIVRSPSWMNMRKTSPTAIGVPTATSPGRTICRSALRGDDVDAPAVVGLLGPLHDAGLLAELGADVLDDGLGGPADRLDGERREEEDEHRAEEPADEDLGLGDVDRLEAFEPSSAPR